MLYYDELKYGAAPMSENPFHQIMNPRSIAIVGAGNSPMKMGTMHALSILKDGYQGKLYPIHPREATVLGTRAYASVEELPEAPDLAMFVVPADQVLLLMRQFGDKGTRRAVIISAGFKETGDGGVRKEKELNDIAARYGIRFVGPNCMGILNSEISLNTTVAALQTKPGKLGFASQSGTYITQVLPYLRKRGIRFSKAISVGNEANLNIIDALEYLGDDEQTKAIALYIEGIRDVPRFLETARKITPRKPVVAQYVGGSGAGARAGKSHTGAMAGPDHLYDGLFRQAGIIRVHSVEDLYGHGWALATQPRMRGRRVGVITNSGGPSTAISNTCELGGCEVPPFSEALQERIRPLIPPHAPSGNPVDLTFSLDIDALTVKIPEMVMQSGEVDGVVLHGAMRSGFMKAIYPHIRELVNNAPMESIMDMWKADFSGIAPIPYEYGVPMTISSFFDNDDDFTVAYHDADIPVYDSPEKAARAMVSLLRYHEIAGRKPYAAPVLPAPYPEAKRILDEAARKGRRSLDEHEAKELLRLYGLPVTDERLAASEAEVSRAAGELGFPLVVKACDPEILHKTEKGLIRLNLKSAEEALAAYRSIREAAGREVPVLVYRMVKGDREFTAGMTRHPGFGACILFGLGGIFTEALADASFRTAPLSQREAEEMFDDIKARKLLGNFRGMPAVNRESLADLLCRLSHVAVLHPEIAEIDMNPVIISGSEPVAVDALVVLV